MRALVVEDHENTRYMASTCLKLRWPQAEVFEAATAAEGLDLAGKEALDLVILDIGLPDTDGRELLAEIRAFSDVPIIMLTGRDEDLDLAASLEAGADDYVTKLFSPVELLARIQAVTRRAQGGAQPVNPALSAGDLVLDFDAAEVYKNSNPVRLTLTELRILEQLARNAQRAVSYEALVSKVFNVEHAGLSDRRIVRVHVQHLRSKLGDSASSPRLIANVRGVGYKFLLQVTPLPAESRQ